MALDGKFDVVGQGCNCWNRQASGIAAQFVKQFGTDSFQLEGLGQEGNYNKLGCIDSQKLVVSGRYTVDVVNCYTQYEYGRDPLETYADVCAIRMCIKKLCHVFQGYRIGIPALGTGLGNLSMLAFLDAVYESTLGANLSIVIRDEKPWQEVINSGFEEFMVN